MRAEVICTEVVREGEKLSVRVSGENASEWALLRFLNKSKPRLSWVVNKDGYPNIEFEIAQS